MNINDVSKLAELARIDLTDDEKNELLADMEGILGYVKQIESVQVEAGDTDYDLYNIWREDVVEKREFSLELIKKQFPDSQDGFLKVKKIL